MHPFVQLVGVVWLCAVVATIATKDSDCVAVAGFVTVLAGLGYVFLH